MNLRIKRYEQELKAKDTCIRDVMNAMDSILKVNAKIQVVDVLSNEDKARLLEAFKACEKQVDDQKKY